MSALEDETYYDHDEHVINGWPLGNGSYGKCWLLQFDNDKFRVLKILYDHSGFDKENVESKALENFGIPFVPKLYDRSKNHEGEKHYWILIDFIPGADLHSLIAHETGGELIRTSKLVIFKILSCIAFQLSHMKEKNVTHRDLKPGNIMIDGELFAHIIDWGDSTDQSGVSYTTTHGTPVFTAPEVYVRDRTPASDIYSFGGIIHQLITGCHPYQLYFDYPQKILDDFELTVEQIDDINLIIDNQVDEDEKQDKINEILIENRIKRGKVDESFILNPTFNEDEFNKDFTDLIYHCWDLDDTMRPTPTAILTTLDELANKYLSPEQFNDYNRFKARFSEPKKEYGNIDTIESTLATGICAANPTLSDVLSELGYSTELDSGEENFVKYLRTIM